MSKLLKLRIGVSDDPSAVQPTLNECIEAMLKQTDMLTGEVLEGLVLAAAPSGARRIPGFGEPGTRQAIQGLSAQATAFKEEFRRELARLVYEGGGKEQSHSEVRYEDLRLFEDDELDQSIEVARALQEVQIAVDDVLPALDALVSTLLGWRTIQPGLNPLRPDVYVRALQHALAHFVAQAEVREVLITPAAGLLGANLRRLYKELGDWLRSCGVEPAVPVGGRVHKGSGAQGAAVVDSVARKLLTLDRLRKLLHGDFDASTARPDFIHTLPASLNMLEEMKGGVDQLMQKLEKRKPAAPAPAPVDMLAEREQPADALPRLGEQLGAEVVRLMFDNLDRDARLLPAFKAELRAVEPAVQALSARDSRFFSDRTHPARLFLDRITQRSLGFPSASEPGWERFLATVQAAVSALQSSTLEAEAFGEQLERMQGEWTGHDQVLRQRREDAARALLHAEQRNLLAQKLAADFAAQVESLDVPEFVADFLRSSWAQVVAEAQLSCADGSDDPFGYRALVEDLVWSVQRSTATRGRAKRLVRMIPGLLSKLREGLDRIEYPPELTARFFNNLIVIHRAAVHEGRDALSQAQADAVEAEASAFSQSMLDEAEALWLDRKEAEESGFIDERALEPDHVASPEATLAEPDAGGAAAAPELRTGSWVELMVKGAWVRAQLTWASPHGTLFMFTSQSGNAHSMSRRTLDRLLSAGQIKIVAERNIVDEALDEVARAALKNSLGAGTPR